MAISASEQFLPTSAHKHDCPVEFPMVPGSRQADGGGQAQILLVEDDAGDALLVEELLADHGHEFELVWARTLGDALGKVGPGIDCILLDLGLPDAVGLDGLQQILDMAGSPPVVVLTGLHDRQSGAQSVALGAQDYLSKDSLDDETLSRSLRYAITRQHAREASLQLRDAELLRAENSRLERGLLPRPLILNPRLSWSTRYAPGGGRALLGGDFFDAIELEDGTVRVVIGDVCGHGPDEAALGVALRVAWRALVLAGQTPERTLWALERVLEVERVNVEIFATVCDMEIAPDLRQANLRLGGHPGPLLFDGLSVVEAPVSVRRPALGLDGEAPWSANRLDLGDEWTLAAFTDGIVEGRSGQAGGRLETTGLIDLAERAFEESTGLEKVGQLLLAGAEEANGGPLQDDVALILLSTSPAWRRASG
jgi:serine phosphatase RsbU (regulator of sigma subunit)